MLHGLDCCCSSTRAVAVVGLAGGSTASSGTPAALDQGVGKNPTKPHCKDGGDAAVAQDGLLDMNFCLK